MRGVAAGTARIHEMPVIGDFDRCCQLAHHLGGCRDFTDRLLLHAQADDESRDLRRAQFTAHDLPHDVQHLVVEHLAMFHGSLDRFGDRDLLHGCAPSMKFCSIRWPCSVRSASGWNWTPSSANSWWRTPMISPSSASAVIFRQAGSDSRSTASE